MENQMTSSAERVADRYIKANLLEEAKDAQEALDNLHASLMNLTRDLVTVGASLNDLSDAIEGGPAEKAWKSTRKVYQKASDQLQYSVWEVFKELQTKVGK